MNQLGNGGRTPFSSKLGDASLMQARDIMSRHVVTIDGNASVMDAINLMLSHHISGLPVLGSDGKLIGILSEGDFVRRVEIGTQKKHRRLLSLLVGDDQEALDYLRQHGKNVSQIMTADPVTVPEDTPIEDIARLMERQRVKRLPVMRGDELVGIVSRADFMTAIADASIREFGISATDRDIKAAVIAALSKAPWRPCALNVTVHDGVVSLRGHVRSSNAHKATIAAVENVSGVKRVDDRLTRIARPPPEEDYGGGDFVSVESEPSTDDDEPL